MALSTMPHLYQERTAGPLPEFVVVATMDSSPIHLYPGVREGLVLVYRTTVLLN